ncbi:hypothetical protein [Tropicimonas sp. IMCC6043]|uniref:hypothetical protein n=1 Tax=Tropicimonas sp. IMCC6043 TaxID=2510645 RepID=UPI00101CF914|nr:hypothetical protein [Tropicimonas sp. IMCC6043]RYH08762.1 hypothetical protein EU800_14870 [Tropicimonas sp. IMCC6043]
MIFDTRLQGIFRWTRQLALIAVAASFSSGVALAQESEEDYHSSPSMATGEDRTSAANQATAWILRIIDGDSERCGQFPWVYRYDCLSYVFKDAAAVRTNKPSDYRKAQEILATGGAKLSALVDQYEDPAQPPSRIGNRTIRAVKQTARAEVEPAARAIIKETETLLLRSGGTPRKQVQYDKIAMAVSSTELLLRSALENLPGFPGHAIRTAHRFAAVVLLTDAFARG